MQAQAVAPEGGAGSPWDPDWGALEERVARAEVAFMAAAGSLAAVARVRARCEPLNGELVDLHRRLSGVGHGGWRVASALLVRLLVAHIGAVQAGDGDERG